VLPVGMPMPRRWPVPSRMLGRIPRSTLPRAAVVTFIADRIRIGSADLKASGAGVLPVKT
jgi:hypothetical protein